MKDIIGRKKECERLQECLEEEQAQLIVVYGRRRVGKTFLINEFFDNQFSFKLTGAYNQTKSYQLNNFANALKRKYAIDFEMPKDWVQAFELLRNYMESLPANEKKVVFIDEMPWLDTKRSGFLAAFEWFWNDFGCTQKNLVFLVCGSATSWMVDNLDKNKGGLFNRQTCRLYLKPFTLSDVEAYLESKGFMWSRYDIVECYMIMGGIPFYLSLLRKSLSLDQNIDRLFFEDKCELWDEFSNLYATLFSNSDSYVKIVEVISARKNGLTRNEIIEKTGIPSNGAFTKMLNNLVDAGFVRISNFYGRKKKDALYQIADFFTAFYFHFIKGYYGRDEHFWSNSKDNPSRRAWEGLTFEQLCMDHIYEIKKKIGISGVLSEETIWYTKSFEDEDGYVYDGAQIDLLIERRDHVINICEIKFSEDEYTIDKKYDMSLRKKIASFKKSTNCKKSIQLSFITTYGVRKNRYSNVVSNEVVLDDLFA